MSYASSIENASQSGSSLISGRGGKACEVTCLNVCGTGVMSEIVVGVQNALGLGETEAEAFKNATALCESKRESGQSQSCNSKDSSPAMRSLITTRGGWETGLKSQRVNGARATVEYLKSARTEATESNCVVR